MEEIREREEVVAARGNEMNLARAIQEAHIDAAKHHKTMYVYHNREGYFLSFRKWDDWLCRVTAAGIRELSALGKTTHRSEEIKVSEMRRIYSDGSFLLPVTKEEIQLNMTKKPHKMQYMRKPFNRAKYINDLHLLTNGELVAELASEIVFTQTALRMAETLEHTRQEIDFGIMDAIFQEVTARLLEPNR